MITRVKRVRKLADMLRRHSVKHEDDNKKNYLEIELLVRSDVDIIITRDDDKTDCYEKITLEMSMSILDVCELDKNFEENYRKFCQIILNRNVTF